jgi:hypothetical protein
MVTEATPTSYSRMPAPSAPIGAWWRTLQEEASLGPVCGLTKRGLVRQQHRGVGGGGYYGHHWKLPETEDAV